jgi:histidinol-phosphate aminotransferase
VTIICSPNNPTGCAIAEPDLVSLLELSNGLVVVDEAYFEFADETAVSLLDRHDNLVVLRTFSKAMALAALRVGYLLTTPNLAREISKALLPYNLNLFSQTAAEVAIEMYDSKLRPLVKLILLERDRVYSELAGISGLEPVSSRANFIVVRSSVEPRRVFDALLQRGILIRDVSAYPMLQDYFRIGIGTPEENDQLLGALRNIFAA